ncbi:MAG: hypothetical protein FD138_2983 [Planctomycetota bacterium]|nr:MAG: hypothetical protein FD138_2983 [Planctomycetota bacterium]
MTDKEARVAALIKNAFHGVTLGNGVGLLQGQGLDDYADYKTLAEYRSQDEKEDWSRIPVEALTRCHSSLSFFDAEGMRFHLPAFLIADLEGTLGQEVIFTLTHLAHGIESRFDLLSLAQREAVRELLLLRRSETIFEFERREIEAALEAYWLP